MEKRKPFEEECSDEESNDKLGDGRKIRRFHSSTESTKEWQTTLLALEPLLSKMVQEEVERIMNQRCLQMRADESTNPSTPTLKLESRIVRERPGKRPLLIGDVVTIKDGAAVVPELRFTDNSSWTKSGRFRIGARVSPAGSYRGPRIKEAVSEGFKVKDHRGESYQKHHPPALGDAVWRLVKIGKGGVFHQRLATAGINTVQDFLIKFHLDPIGLRQILGGGMSNRTWECTTRHAQTCDVGGGLYVHRGLDCDLLLDSVCQVVRVIEGTKACTPHNLDREVYVQDLTREAYKNWGNLEQYDANDVISPDLWMPRAAAVDEGRSFEGTSSPSVWGTAWMQ